MSTPKIIPISTSTIVLGPGECCSSAAKRLTRIMLDDDAKLVAPNLETVTELVFCSRGARLEAPHFRIAKDINIGRNGNVDMSALEQVLGSVELRELGSLEAKSLLRIRGNVILHKGAYLNTVSLEAVMGSIHTASSGVMMAPRMINVVAEIEIAEGGSLAFTALTQAGYLQLGKNSMLKVPGMNTAGDIYVAEGAVLGAGELEECGTIYLDPGAELFLPDLTTIIGDLAMGQAAKLTAPSLNSIKGDVTLLPLAEFKTGPGAGVTVEGSSQLDPTAEWEHKPIALRSGIKI